MTMPLDPQKAIEYRQNLSKSLIGKKKSEEHKAKLKEAKRIKPPPGQVLGWKEKPRVTTSWYQRNREYAKKKRKIDYRRMLEEKAGRPKPKNCDACGGTKRICFDHCHKTGEFRGWLCESCNVLIGFAKDDINTLKRLVKYLEKS